MANPCNSDATRWSRVLKGTLDAPEEIEGLAIEGLVGLHLRAWASYRSEATELMFWRTKSGREVDFVLYGSNLFVAIEVKRSSRVDRHDLAALKAFGDDYPEARLVLVSLASEALLMYPGGKES